MMCHVEYVSRTTSHRAALATLLVAATFVTGPGFAQLGPSYEGLDADLVQSSDPANNTTQAIEFGASVDLDEDLLAIGAPGEDSAIDGTVDVGAVYIFERQGGDWVRLQKLRAPTERLNGDFGAAVAVARGEDVNGPIDFLFVGEPQGTAPKVHIYSRTPGGIFVLDSTHSDMSCTAAPPECLPTPAGSGFGRAIDLDFFVPPNSLNGDPLFFAVVGAMNKSDPSVSGSSLQGSVVIFQRSGGPPTWGPVRNLLGEFFGGPNEQLGEDVAMSGANVIAAGALDGLGVGSGGARLYQQANFEGTIYVYAGDCAALPTAQVPHVGKKTVAINAGSLAAFGMPEDDEIAQNNGKVLIFDFASCIGNVITPVATLYPPDTSALRQFGSSLSFFGTTLAVGATGNLVNESGKVYVYERGADNTEWNLAATLTLDRISPVVTSCRGAEAVALGVDHLVAGCPSGGNPQHEAGYVFSLEIFSDGFESGDVSAWQ